MSVDLSTRVGDVALRSLVLTAAGTSGYGDELAGYGDLRELGGVVVKSLAAFAWEGNPAPRVAGWGDHLLNAVGLAGPGVAAWRRDWLPALDERGVSVVGSIWGRTVDEFAAAAAAMQGSSVVALEVNVSCPNLDEHATLFAYSAQATADVVAACGVAEVPLWVKLSPNTPDLVEIAGRALDAGAEGLVLVNTLLGLVIDVERRAATLGHGTGGVSGPGLFPVALRAVYECRAAYPTVPIVGVGGVRRVEDVVAMVMAGADAVEVGSVTFADPRAPWRLQRGVARWLRRHGVARLDEIRGAAHG